MKTIFNSLKFAIILLFGTTTINGQVVNEKIMRPTGDPILHPDGKIKTFKVSSIKIVDGVIDMENFVPTNEVSKEWELIDSTAIKKLIDKAPPKLVITNTKLTPIEKYIYSKVKHETEKYNIPIIINNQFMASYLMRRETIRFITPNSIKSISYISKKEAQEKYGNSIVWGAIEILKLDYNE